MRGFAYWLTAGVAALVIAVCCLSPWAKRTWKRWGTGPLSDKTKSTWDDELP
jgi:hypothetical protein